MKSRKIKVNERFFIIKDSRFHLEWIFIKLQKGQRDIDKIIPKIKNDEYSNTTIRKSTNIKTGKD